MIYESGFKIRHNGAFINHPQTKDVKEILTYCIDYIDRLNKGTENGKGFYNFPSLKKVKYEKNN